MDKELEKAMQKYSEIHVNPPNTYEVPHTIKNYKERIKANDSLSVFDSDFSTLYNRSGDEVLSNAANGDSGVPFQKEPVFKVSFGRGRGMMSKKFRPGNFSDDNDIKNDLRKIAPLGYSNEVTELAINSKKKRSEKNTLNSSQFVHTQSASMSEEKLENTSQPPISQILQGSKKKRDSAYRALLKQKEHQKWNEMAASERKIKELLEEDRKQFYTDLESSYDDFVATDQQTETSVNCPWGKGYRYSSELNLNSSSDFPPLSGKK